MWNYRHGPASVRADSISRWPLVDDLYSIESIGWPSFFCKMLESKSRLSGYRQYAVTVIRRSNDIRYKREKFERRIATGGESAYIGSKCIDSYWCNRVTITSSNLLFPNSFFSLENFLLSNQIVRVRNVIVISPKDKQKHRLEKLF